MKFEVNKMIKVKKGMLLLIGLYLSALGIVLSIVSSIGITPINTITYAVNMKYPTLTLGEWTMILNYTFIFMQILILRREFKFKELFQIVIVIIFGWFLDVNNLLLANLQVDAYIMQFILLLIGTVLMALGISVVIKANGPMNPGEALVNAISIKSKISFENCKIIFDVSIVLIKIIFSYLSMGTIEGVREGTIIMATLTGLFIKYFNKKLVFLPKSA